MTRFRLVLTSILVFAFIAVVAAYAGRRTAAEMTDGIPARSFEFTYQVHVPANSDSAGPAHLWIPLPRSEEHTSELQSQSNLVCRLLLEKKKLIKMTLHACRRSCLTRFSCRNVPPLRHTRQRPLPRTQA